MALPVDFGWVKALRLPTKITVGLFLFFVLLLLFDGLSILSLADFGSLVRSSAIVGVLLFGSLSVTSLVAIYQKPRMLAARRKVRTDEHDARRAEYETDALARLDYLSQEEIRHVADCLRKNEQSFLGYFHSGPIANLQAKGLVDTPGGSHHQDHYPYFFVDFAWRALLERKDEFIEKDDEFQRQESSSRRRR